MEIIVGAGKDAMAGGKEFFNDVVGAEAVVGADEEDVAGGEQSPDGAVVAEAVLVPNEESRAGVKEVFDHIAEAQIINRDRTDDNEIFNADADVNAGLLVKENETGVKVTFADGSAQDIGVGAEEGSESALNAVLDDGVKAVSDLRAEQGIGVGAEEEGETAVKADLNADIKDDINVDAEVEGKSTVNWFLDAVLWTGTKLVKMGREILTEDRSPEWIPRTT
ncbi:hypothetical protein KVT40_009242 [Elsinoe batatas]|uniref:Uncharacterized protein n=1 Tax=Elsinoe batatas TaxID=2601811 RepID=A0A8K0KTC9_9PEZI|nr:hypothetical protein KVT40_009242 [Elsinoe batatas]